MDEDKWKAVGKVLLVMFALWSFSLYFTDDSPKTAYPEDCGGISSRLCG
jgi:hypothetical protein